MTTSRIFTIAFVALTGYLLLGAATTLQALRPWDIDGVLWVQQFIHPFWDAAFAVVAIVGSTEVVLMLAVAAAGWLWLRGHRALAIVLLAYLAMYPFELIGKLFLPQDPPGPDLVRLPYHYPLANLHVGHSFPSGHAARLTFFATLAWFVLQGLPPVARWIGRGALLLVVVPSLASRVYIGAHWPSDILGGICLGIAIACAALGWYATPALQPSLLQAEQNEPVY